MLNKFTILILCFQFCIANSQVVQIKYKNKVSPIVFFEEVLNADKDFSISTRDSIIRFEDGKTFPQMENTVVEKDLPSKISVYKKMANRQIYVQQRLDNKMYFIMDEMPKINWEIHKENIKIILNYLCFQAKASFRGSEIVAYFTNDIEIPSGPYKFSGLPGMILEISEQNKDYNSWIATSITMLKTKLNIENNKLKLKSISLKEFVEMEDDKYHQRYKKYTSKLPANVKIERKIIGRFAVEKKYEWEN